MTTKIELTIEWEPCEGEEFSIETDGDVLDWIEGTIESNAHFEHLDIALANIYKLKAGL